MPGACRNITPFWCRRFSQPGELNRPLARPAISASRVLTAVTLPTRRYQRSGHLEYPPINLAVCFGLRHLRRCYLFSPLVRRAGRPDIPASAAENTTTFLADRRRLTRPNKQATAETTTTTWNSALTPPPYSNSQPRAVACGGGRRACVARSDVHYAPPWRTNNTALCVTFFVEHLLFLDDRPSRAGTRFLPDIHCACASSISIACLKQHLCLHRRSLCYLAEHLGGSAGWRYHTRCPASAIRRMRHMPPYPIASLRCGYGDSSPDARTTAIHCGVDLHADACMPFRYLGAPVYSFCCRVHHTNRLLRAACACRCYGCAALSPSENRATPLTCEHSPSQRLHDDGGTARLLTPLVTADYLRHRVAYAPRAISFLDIAERRSGGNCRTLFAGGAEARIR